MNVTETPGIITQEQFDNGTSQWQQAVSTHNLELLQGCFSGGTDLLQYVSFPIDQITKLVSTIGLYRIKAKFCLLPDAATSLLHFAVVLFAADSNNLRISSYYVNFPYWSSTVPPSLPTAEVPHSLAQVWLDNWKVLTNVEPSMFEVYGSPLEGYTFEAEDFIRPFFGLQAGAQADLHVRFGLHEYYQNTPTGDVEMRTLGLVLQLYSPGQTSEPVFDISMPCPYTC
ncbi:hypothetical protein [Hymenobacter jeollabukensis]|uniref:Uncharacterized protein n=1 Tax=Hymenobacter jeollabukensis TaxID=2025313 RepID=A0A5R8WKK7_9BACT|nr:hypothetical protein [Hymenobacter jeollabukensis]TLM89420.1 hypothetical protein FDY95_20315 [Hymenobacter jeollabukensis]